MICSTSAENVPSDMTRPSNVDSNQPVHSRSVIRVFVVRIKKLCTLGYPNCVQRILIRLRECAGWSVSSLGAYVRKYVFWRCGSYVPVIWAVSWEKSPYHTYADNKDPDRPAYPGILARVFVVHLQIGYGSIYCRTTKAFDGADTQADLGVLWLQIV